MLEQMLKAYPESGGRFDGMAQAAENALEDALRRGRRKRSERQEAGGENASRYAQHRFLERFLAAGNHRKPLSSQALRGSAAKRHDFNVQASGRLHDLVIS